MKKQQTRRNIISSILGFIILVCIVVFLFLAIGMLGAKKITTVENGLETLKTSQFLIYYLFLVISTIIIADKTRTKNSWLAWLPIGQQYLWVKMAGYRGISIFLFLIPIVNFIFVAMIWNKIAFKLGVGKGMVIVRFWISIFITLGHIISLVLLGVMNILIPIDLFVISILALKREETEIKIKKRLIRSVLHFILVCLLVVVMFSMIFIIGKQKVIFENHAMYCEGISEEYKYTCYGLSAIQTDNPEYCKFLETKEKQAMCLDLWCPVNHLAIMFSGATDDCQEQQKVLLDNFDNSQKIFYEVFKKISETLLKE